MLFTTPATSLTLIQFYLFIFVYDADSKFEHKVSGLSLILTHNWLAMANYVIWTNLSSSLVQFPSWLLSENLLGTTVSLSSYYWTNILYVVAKTCL